MAKAELQEIGLMKIEFGEFIEVISGEGDGISKGSQLVIGINALSLKGENIDASMAMGDASVSATVIDEGLATLEVSVTLRTDDGAFVRATWSGRAYLGEGLVATAPTFRTADDRYKWLNRVQAVGAGEEDIAAGKLVYRLYDVKLISEPELLQG